MSIEQINKLKLTFGKLLDSTALVAASTVGIFIFYYFNELGYFIRNQIPKEFIQIELWTSVKYIPGYLCLVFLIIILYEIVPTRFWSSRPTLVCAGIIVIGLGSVPYYMYNSYDIKWISVIIILAFSIKGDIIGNKTVVFQYVRGLSPYVLVFSVCIFICFFKGFLDIPPRIINPDGKALVRRYSAYSIYYLGDTTIRVGVFRKFKIQYPEGDPETILFFKKYVK